ncbi:putative toxin-antitoxin system toxin component, PIN family [bacterium]|nr:putative toxin-antitoxin system toxin component, PIN family [bacterium]RIK60518.1 MAG: putative toxin-antitoxin system toxin component, PIN family [candidate division KSB1 bacterium]
MKALLDTNPLVSALLKPSGVSGQIFQRWRRGQFDLAVSLSTLDELSAVLHRPHIIDKYTIRESDIQNHLGVLRNFAEIALGKILLNVVHDDPKDNHVLAAAVDTNSGYLVYGDHHLLDLKEYQGIEILTPRAFLSNLEGLEAQ